MITVLMATHNGARTLPKALDAYLQMTVPRGGSQIVVVDNASTDETGLILTQYAQHLPLQAIHTEKRGKNIALNIGLDTVEGDLIVFTDDDVVPAPDWLVALGRAADSQRGFDIFGGRIEPLWPEQLPEWIHRLVNLGATFGVTPTGLHEGPIAASQVWGANMAVRKSVFDNGYRFDESVGPQAGQYIMGSEVAFTCKLEGLGHKAWFVSDACVKHIIRPNQIERSWIISRAYRLGRHMYHQERSTHFKQGPLILGSPRWKYRQLITEFFLAAKGRVLGNFDTTFRADWEISFLNGYLAEGRKMAKRGQRE